MANQLIFGCAFVFELALANSLDKFQKSQVECPMFINKNRRLFAKDCLKLFRTGPQALQAHNFFISASVDK